MKDPLGQSGNLIPVRVAPVDLPRLVVQLAYLDLVGLDHDTARQRMLTILLKHGQIDATSLSLVGRTRRVFEQANRNRSAMIERVRTIWIDGYLRHSLFNEARILLGLSERPDAVARPFDLLVKRPDEGERTLPRGTQVVDVFDKMDKAILILGAPGSGKTTLLLELARDLLDRADRDPVHEIPVVFPLSTWAEKRKPLVKWLEDELNLRYDVPRAIAHEWVATDQVTPFLDGLDEVKEEYRATCVEAINMFRQSHGFLPLVVTSRTDDYEALAKPLRLHGAILVQPLTHEQVNVYLNDLGPAGEPVCAAIRQDSSLWDLLDSPLLLNIVTVSYSGKMPASPPIHGTVVERRNDLFESYVNEMLRRRAVTRYTPEQTIHCLSWLAFRMNMRGGSIIDLKKLRWHKISRTNRRRIAGAVLILMASAGGLFLGPLFGTWIGLLLGTMLGFAFAMQITGEPIKLESSLFDVKILGMNLIRGATLGVCGGLLVGIIAGRYSGSLIGLMFGTIVAMSCDPIQERIDTEGEKKIRTCWKSVVNGLSAALLFGAIAGLLGGILRGSHFAAIAGITFGLIAGVLHSLNTGATACLDDVVMRCWLALNGYLPWNYVKFLDYAADRILLRKVGGGYMFIHRMMLEWFAARYVEPGVRAEMATKAIDAE